MKNFPFVHDGQTLWFSRSVACTMYMFIYCRESKEWHILLSKRGPGCPSAVGLWNAPGGYLDFDETPADAAKRECWEETGVKIYEPVKMVAVSTNLNSRNQNVVMSFYTTRVVDHAWNVWNHFSRANNEQDEVEAIDIWRVKYFFEFPDDAAKELAFGHDKMIREIYTKYIVCPWWKKLIIKLSDKYLNINLNIQ